MTAVRSRILSLDALRGLAILAILLANISAFAEPYVSYLMSQPTLPKDQEWAFVIREFLVSGKFRSMLAMMFGAGLYLLYASWTRDYARLDGESDYDYKQRIKAVWPGPYVRRMGWLAAIGAVHGIFLWYGDILFVYAITGMVVSAMVHMKEKVMLGLAAGAWFLTLMVGMGMALLELVSGPSSSAWLKDVPGGIYLTAAGETQIFQTGPYWQQLVYRLVFFVLNLFNLPLLLPAVIGLFLTGLWMAKKGILQRPSEHRREVAWLLGIGLGIGLPLNFLPVLLYMTTGGMWLTMAVEMGFAPVLALGYLVLGAILVEKLVFLAKGLATIGRVALSVYLLQTVLATSIFYSFGGGLFGKLNWQQQLMAVGAIWAVCILFAWAWQLRFQIGPVEWAWRSLAERRKRPLVRENQEGEPQAG